MNNTFQNSPRSWLAHAGAYTLIILFSATLTLIGPMALLAFSGIVIGLVFILFKKLQNSSTRNWMFLLMIAAPIALALARKLSGENLFGIWQIVVMLLAPLGFKRFRDDALKSTSLKLFTAFSATFLTLGILSTLLGRSKVPAMLYQLISDIKPMLAILLGYALLWNDSMAKLLWRVARWSWLPMSVLVAAEWAAPGLYFGFFTGHVISVDPTGLFPSRATGAYEHPSFLATYGAQFAILTAAHATVYQKDSKKHWLLTGANLSLAVFAVQRQEIAGFILSCILIFLLSQPKKLISRGLIGLFTGLCAAGVFWTAFGENISTEAQMWGYNTVGPIQQPRAQIFTHSWYIADQYQPLGSGLGTYGGAGADKFDRSLYDQLGFRNYWWYGKLNYLMDTYWPNSIAETGWAGAIALLLSYVALLAHASKQAAVQTGPTSRTYWLAASAMMIYMIVLSFSSPAFQDLRLFILPAMMFGIASSASKDCNEKK